MSLDLFTLLSRGCTCVVTTLIILVVLLSGLFGGGLDLWPGRMEARGVIAEVNRAIAQQRMSAPPRGAQGEAA